MKKILIFLLSAVVILCTFLFVLSDQNETDKWCNTDDYGCWVTTEDGGKSYIYFWSEAARKYIMGDGSKPGSNVVDKYPGAPDYGEGKMPLLDETTYLADFGNWSTITAVTTAPSTTAAAPVTDYVTLTIIGVPFLDNWTNNDEIFYDYTAVYKTGNFTTSITLWSYVDSFGDVDHFFNYITDRCKYLSFSRGTNQSSNMDNNKYRSIKSFLSYGYNNFLSGYYLTLPSLTNVTTTLAYYGTYTYCPNLNSTLPVAIGTH